MQNHDVAGDLGLSGSFLPLENEVLEVEESGGAVGTVELYTYEPVGFTVPIASTGKFSISNGKMRIDHSCKPSQKNILTPCT